MPRPKNWIPYTNAAGARLPGVTTITGRYQESGGLIHWAWEQGAAGLDYRETRDAAASAGTVAHQMVEAYIRQHDYEPDPTVGPAVVDRATQAFENFRKWAVQTRLTPVHTEYRLISEELQVGGTVDAMLIDGEISLGDWKSSDGVYTNYLVQLAAYGLLWEENHPDQPLTGGYHLIRFSKQHADFVHYHFGELQDAKETFILLRRAFDLDKRLKARVR